MEASIITGIFILIGIAGFRWANTGDLKPLAMAMITVPTAVMGLLCAPPWNMIHLAIAVISYPLINWDVFFSKTRKPITNRRPV